VKESAVRFVLGRTDVARSPWFYFSWPFVRVVDGCGELRLEFDGFSKIDLNSSFNFYVICSVIKSAILLCNVFGRLA